MLIFQEKEILKKLLIFQEVTWNAQKTNKKVCNQKISGPSDVFAIFTSVEHKETCCEAKNKSLIMFTL